MQWYQYDGNNFNRTWSIFEKHLSNLIWWGNCLDRIWVKTPLKPLLKTRHLGDPKVPKCIKQHRMWSTYYIMGSNSFWSCICFQKLSYLISIQNITMKEFNEITKIYKKKIGLWIFYKDLDSITHWFTAL